MEFLDFTIDQCCGWLVLFVVVCWVLVVVCWVLVFMFMFVFVLVLGLVVGPTNQPTQTIKN